MTHDITITTPQKTITADTKALEWALDPYAVVFLETVAELIQVTVAASYATEDKIYEK